MKVIFAQGNPEPQYAGTRHNVGFACLNSLATKWGTTFVSKAKFQADIAEASVAGEKVLLVKPTTFYNETGVAARTLVDFYKLDASTDLLVIHDDLALPFGTIRVRQKGSDAGNNGIKSLNAHIGPDYGRVRIGIANDLRSQMGDVDFVLGKFSANETIALEKSIIPKITDLAAAFCADTLETTSHRLQLD